MRKNKQKISVFLLLILFFLVGCSSADTQSLEGYSTDSLTAYIEEGIYEGKSEIEITYKEPKVIMDAWLKEDMGVMLKENPLVSNLLKDIEVTYGEPEKGSQVHLKYKYKDDINAPIITGVNNKIDIINTLIEEWEKHLGKVTFILEGQNYTEADYFSILNTAESNAGLLPYEGREIFYQYTDIGDDLQILNLWVDFPSDQEDMLAKKEALKEKVDYHSALIKDRGLVDAEEIYEAVYDTVVETATYDYDLLFATEEDNLTKDDHLNRSSYGAFVSGHTVCTGYARGFKAICDTLGIPSWVLLGTKDGVLHAWNLVYIDNEPFYIDCTYGDTGEPKETTFLFNTEQLNAAGYVLDLEVILPQ